MGRTPEEADSGGTRVDEMLSRELVRSLIEKMSFVDAPRTVIPRGRNRVNGLTAEMLGLGINREDGIHDQE